MGETMRKHGTLRDQIPFVRRFLVLLCGNAHYADVCIVKILQTLLEQGDRIDLKNMKREQLFRHAVGSWLLLGGHVAPLSFKFKQAETGGLDGCAHCRPMARAAFLLAHVEELPLAEIARAIRCSMETANALIVEARSAMITRVQPANFPIH